MNSATVKRPAGATFLALLLGWLGVAGIFNSFVWWTLPTGFVDRASPQMQSALNAIRTPALSVIALAYGLSALATCVGIWRMRSWMATALTCWVGSLIAFMAYLIVAMPTAPITVLAALSFLIPLALLVVALWLYVARLKTQAAL